MGYLFAGAIILLVGVIIGVAMTQSTIDRVLKQGSDDENSRY